VIVGFNQRWREKRGVYRPQGEPFDPSRFEVAGIADDTTPRTFIETHHYSGSYPPAVHRFGLYRGPELVGVAVLSSPMNDAVYDPFPRDLAAELGRLVLLDEVPANAESWFVARCFELAQREGVEGIVSYSDPEPRFNGDGKQTFKGHIGNVYQALNARYVGRSKARWLLRLPDGSTFSERVLSKIRAGDRGWKSGVAQLRRHGASEPQGDLREWLAAELPKVTQRVHHAGNHRYLFPLTKGTKRLLKGLTDRGELPELPYPKIQRHPSFTLNLA
jgi:hypothetical protein